MPCLSKLKISAAILSLVAYSATYAQSTQRFEMLPLEIQQKSQADLNNFFGADLDKVEFKALAGGMSGTPIYKATYEDKTYVIRVYDANQVSAYKTNMLSRLAGANQLGPETFFPTQDIPSKVLITGFASGELADPSQYHQYKQDLASVLRRLHQLKVDALPRGVDLFMRSQIRMKQVGEFGPFLEDYRVLNSIDNALTLHPFEFGLTHQDLNTLNVFHDGKDFYFIDWVNGGYGDVMGDVANLTLEFGLNDAEALEFLTLYLKHTPTKQQAAQFNLWRQVATFRLIAWAYEKIHSLGGQYAAIEPKWTLTEIVKLARAGKFEPTSPEDFHQILEAARVEWHARLKEVAPWIKQLHSNPQLTKD